MAKIPGETNPVYSWIYWNPCFPSPINDSPKISARPVPKNIETMTAILPTLTKFFLNCCEKVPLNINCEMLMKHSFIEGEVSLAEYLGGVDILRISIKANL